MSEMPPIIPSENGGWIVPIEYGSTRVEAAKSLSEEECGGPTDTQEWDRAALITLARTAHHKTDTYFKVDIGDDYWWTPYPDGIDGADGIEDAFFGWFFDAAFAHLEECVVEMEDQ